MLTLNVHQTLFFEMNLNSSFNFTGKIDLPKIQELKRVASTNIMIYNLVRVYDFLVTV